MADAKPETILAQIRSQLQRELDEDVPAVAEAFRTEFEERTVELKGPEATAYMQAQWLQGKGHRDTEEIDRVGGKKWWKEYFEHVGTDMKDNKFAQDVFYTAIKAGVPYIEALKYTRVLGGLPSPPRPPMAPPMPQPEMMPPPMPPEAMAPPPPEMMAPPPMPEPMAPPMEPVMPMPMPGVV